MNNIHSPHKFFIQGVYYEFVVYPPISKNVGRRTSKTGHRFSIRIKRLVIFGVFIVLSIVILAILAIRVSESAVNEKN